MRRRAIIRLTVFVLLGAIVNVAVAWALALGLHANTTNPIKQGWKHEFAHMPVNGKFMETHWHVRRLSRFGSSLVVVTSVSNPAPSQLHFEDLLPPVPGIFEDIERFEWYGPAVVRHPGHLYWDGRGWPCLAMSAHWTWITNTWPNPPITSGIMLGKPKAPRIWPWGVHDLHALPLTPLWPGFAINTLFYAATLWIMLAALSALRRWRRIRRGVCPNCAYPIGSSEVCTECGRPVVPRRVGP